MKEQIDKVTTAYILQRMEEYDLDAVDLTQHLGIDKSTISLLLNNVKPLTKWHKAAFYHFFRGLYYREIARSVGKLKEDY